MSLVNDRIKPEVAIRQQKTAAEILKRFDKQPGVILADEVGMGKTYVALAVAVSVVEATDYKRSVVVMVPPSVQTKWPREWDVFLEECYSAKKPVRATTHSVNKGSDFLKLLDDPASRRQHLIFMTHGALTSSLADPLVKLAIVRRAFLRRSSLAKQRRAFPRWASKVLANRQLSNEELVRALLDSHPREWRGIYEEETGKHLTDDPVPEVLLRALDRTDISALLDVLRALPLAKSAYLDQRLQEVRGQVNWLLSDVWRRSLREAHIHLPLLVMDEAHHTKNPYSRVAGLFANPESREDVELLKGPLGRVFDRMLFLTATPFQLGHRELVEVLKRFEGIRWGGNLDRATYVSQLEELERSLNVAQTAALRLDRAWGRLTEADLITPQGQEPPADKDESSSLRQALAAVKETEAKIREAERLLRPWVIRHTRDDKEIRRNVHCGAGILNGEDSDRGLVVSGSAVLPFLLAARAQGIVAAQGRFAGQRTRAFFAEGLASSFEAYRETRRRRDTEDVSDDIPRIATEELPEEVDWYLKHLDKALPKGSEGVWGHHPKINATVSRAVKLWERGEKVLVFCFYRATGRALRNHISRAMESHLLSLGATRLGIAPDDDSVREELARWSERFDNGRVRREALQILSDIFADASLAPQEKEQSIAVCLRFLRTASFLVRFVDLGNRDRVGAVRSAFERGEGMTLRETFAKFAHFLASRVEAERVDLLAALDSIQTGEIFAASTDASEQEGHVTRAERILPNVRLANGEVERHTRYRLMLAFNSPFFPEVLVASSVMGEGVDLHLNCRYVIHHDLDWNPSVIEQRTGRLDRLSSKAEALDAPVVVFEPFLEGTQDEKQFRVMKDRERWFNVVMGERLELDEWSVDHLAQRVPIPRELAERLTMRLDLRPTRKLRQ